MIAAKKSDDPYADLRRVNPKALICVGYEDAYLGVLVDTEPVAVYDLLACIDIVIGEGDLTHDEASAYFCFYTLSKCRGVRNAPRFVRI